jgi:hypothetical protein
MGYVFGAIGALLIGFVLVMLFLEPLVPRHQHRSARIARGSGAGSATRS